MYNTHVKGPFQLFFCSKERISGSGKSHYLRRNSIASYERNSNMTQSNSSEITSTSFVIHYEDISTSTLVAIIDYHYYYQHCSFRTTCHLHHLIRNE